MPPRMESQVNTVSPFTRAETMNTNACNLCQVGRPEVQFVFHWQGPVRVSLIGFLVLCQNLLMMSHVPILQ